MAPSMPQDTTFRRGTTPRFYQRSTDRSALPRQQTEFETVDSTTPAPVEVMAAFFAYVQSQLAALRHAPRPTDPRSTTLLTFLDSLNLSAEEVGRIGLGLFTSVSDVRTYLRSVGFSETVIDDSGLLETEHGAPRYDWQHCLVLPVFDRFHEIVDWLRVDLTLSSRRQVRYTPMFGFEESGVPVYGTDGIEFNDGPARDVLLVDDVLDAARLRIAGVANVLATAGREDCMSPHRWEQLADLGLQNVTLLFRNSADAHYRIRNIRRTALQARRTPQIHVFDSMRFGPEGSACEFVRGHGVSAFQKLISNASLVYHAKDLDWTPWTSARWRRPAPSPFHAETFWSTVNWHLGNIHDVPLRSTFTRIAADVADALGRGAYREARNLLVHLPQVTHETVAPVSLQKTLQQLQEDARAERLVVPTASPAQATVTTISVDHRDALIPRMAQVLVENLHRGSDSNWIVVCDDPERMTLHLVHELANRQTTGPGLTIAETVDRLAHRDPQDGFGDKPWIVDESVDLLQRWEQRVRFVPASARWDNELLTAPARSEAPTGILVGLSQQQASRSEPGAGFTAKLFRIAGHFGCEVVAVTAAEPGWFMEPSDRTNGNGTTHATTHNDEVVRFRELLGEIIDRAEHRERQHPTR